MFDEKSVSKEVLAEILKEIDEGIHVVDLYGKTTFYNQVAAKHDGMSVDEVIGQPLLQVFPSLSEESSTLLRVLKTKKAQYHITQVYTNVHGKQIETINSTIPIWIKGKLVGAMEIAKDYSTLRRMSERLIDLQNTLKGQSRSKKQDHIVKYTLDDLLTKHPPFILIINQARKLAKSPSSILVYGESGTGKELFVQGIHHASPRRDSPFIAQNCAAIPENLLESLLFGTAKGSYTGAVDRPGLFELADGGTLFLDEVHAMPFDLQAKLLRVLEDGMIRRIGAAKNSYVNVRVIAAMNMHPDEALTQQKLRTDLFYRLNVLTFRLPPLRERREDILYLAEQFVLLFNQQMSKSVSELSEQIKEIFTSYSWPGNVRELKHTLEFMMTICDGDKLEIEHLPMMLRGKKDVSAQREESMREKMAKFERKLILEALEAQNGNIKRAAEMLQIPRQTLQYKLQKWKEHG